MEMRLKHGFTLMEIMIVVVIIGILLAFIGPQIMRMMGKSAVAKDMLLFQKVKDALVNYKLDNNNQDPTDYKALTDWANTKDYDLPIGEKLLFEAEAATYKADLKAKKGDTLFQEIKNAKKFDELKAP